MSISKLLLKYIIVCLVFILKTTSTSSQTSYYFKNLSTLNGLSQNAVSSVLQDSDGMMWFSTQVGIDKHVGNNIIRQSGLNIGLTEKITILYDWSQNYLFVGTTNENYLVHKWKADSIKTMQTKLKSIRYIFNVGSDSLLALTDSCIYLCDNLLSKVISHSSKFNSKINSVLKCRTGDVWFVATDSLCSSANM